MDRGLSRALVPFTFHASRLTPHVSRFSSKRKGGRVGEEGARSPAGAPVARAWSRDAADVAVSRAAEPHDRLAGHAGVARPATGGRGDPPDAADARVRLEVGPVRAQSAAPGVDRGGTPVRASLRARRGQVRRGRADAGGGGGG